ncbi:MAG: pentapeptide repeat-containing protein [Bacilli bacterium]|nr:pentapeptide repeat-containing protein [Bacilli bacterium]
MLKYNHIIELRTALKEELESYMGKDHIKLSVDDKLLKRILIENKKFAIDFELVKKLDLTGFKFFNIDISGLDFTGSKGVRINPQKILNKDMHLCKLNSVTIKGSLDDVLIIGTDFTGSNGARINPEKVAFKNMSCAKLNDAKIISDVKNVYIAGTDFSGCIGGAKIYVDEVIDKDLRYTIFNGCNLYGTFRWAKVENTNFSHSKGAVLDAQRLYGRSLNGTKLTDAELLGSLTGVDIRNTIFYGCKDRKIYKSTCETKELIKIIKEDFKK